MKENCFVINRGIVVLKLNNNKISMISTTVFSNLKSLKLLNLANSNLNEFSYLSLETVPNLVLLFVPNNSFSHLTAKSFRGLTVKFLITNDNKICCISALLTNCLLGGNEMQKHCNLLPTKIVETSFYCISVITVILNSFSAFLQRKSQIKMKIYEFIVEVINFTDITCGLYLFSLWIYNLIYETNFALKKLHWKSNVLCYTAFGIILKF